MSKVESALLVAGVFFIASGITTPWTQLFAAITASVWVVVAWQRVWNKEDR